MGSRYIGVDVGGTKVSVAALEDGVLSGPVVEPTERSSTEALLAQLASLVATVAGPAGANGVGVGVPSVVDIRSGRARASVNVPLADVPLRDELAARTGLPVALDNDATVAALAEACDDRGEPEIDTLVMLTVGTGVGGGIIIGGRPYHGATGAAAELGHVLVGLDLRGGAPPGAPRFPQPGSLESLASGRALDELGLERGIGEGPAVVAAARAGDERAIEALRILGSRLGVGIASMINIFDPHVLCVGGGASAAGELLLGPARETARQYVLPGAGTATEIRLARWGPGAGVRGAALLARHELGR